MLKSIKIISMTYAVIIVLIATSRAFTHGSGQVPDAECCLMQLEDALVKTEHLEKKIANLESRSEHNLNYYADLYDELYDREMKLVYQHITYSSRLISDSDAFLKNEVAIKKTKDKAIYLDLRKRSALTAYEIDEYVLKETKLAGLGANFIQAEIDHGVNAFFLLALAIHESGWGTSAIARDKNNLFGFGAFDNSPYKSAIYFSTKGECIDKVAKHLSINYFDPNGKHFSGGYTLKHVNKKYASDELWSVNISKSIDKFNREIIRQQDVEYHQAMKNQNEGI